MLTFSLKDENPKSSLLPKQVAFIRGRTLDEALIACECIDSSSIKGNCFICGLKQMNLDLPTKWLWRYGDEDDTRKGVQLPQVKIHCLDFLVPRKLLLPLIIILSKESNK